AEVRHPQVAQELPPVRVRVRPHPARALRRELLQLRKERPVLVEELVRPVALEPVLEQLQVISLAGIRERHLVGAPEVLDLLPVDLLRAGPALRRAEDEHRPLRALRASVLARLAV